MISLEESLGGFLGGEDSGNDVVGTGRGGWPGWAAGVTPSPSGLPDEALHQTGLNPQSKWRAGTVRKQLAPRKSRDINDFSPFSALKWILGCPLFSASLAAARRDSVSACLWAAFPGGLDGRLAAAEHRCMANGISSG